MAALIIDGKKISLQIIEEIKRDVDRMIQTHQKRPGLVTILVGENPSSVSYVTGKQKQAKELGFYSIQDNQEDTITENRLLELIDKYNNDPDIHGILVQLPLPKHIDENKIIMAIKPEKDVDGFHPVNLGKMMIGAPGFLPCTPAGIQEILVRSNIETDGADIVIVGRSNIVGKPVANILFQKAKGANATVTVCHTRTKELASHTMRADILIVAAGSPRCITADMVKPGAVVIDVGTHRIGTTASGKAKLCGDVDFESVKDKASMITPVPGGVGPMTITMLMKNTLKSAQVHYGIIG